MGRKPGTNYCVFRVVNNLTFLDLHFTKTVMKKLQINILYFSVIIPLRGTTAYHLILWRNGTLMQKNKTKQKHVWNLRQKK